MILFGVEMVNFQLRILNESIRSVKPLSMVQTLWAFLATLITIAVIKSGQGIFNELSITGSATVRRKHSIAQLVKGIMLRYEQTRKRHRLFSMGNAPQGELCAWSAWWCGS